MSWSNITDLNKYTMPELPGIDSYTLLEETRNAIIEWANQTRAYTCDLDPILLVKDQDTYDLDVPSAGTVIAIGKVERDGVEIDPITDYVMPSHCSIKLIAAPAADTNTSADETGLEIEVEMMPTLTTTIVPYDLFILHAETWKYGTLAKCMRMVNKRWSNEGAGARYEALFWDRIGLERINQLKGSTNANLTASSPYPFFL